MKLKFVRLVYFLFPFGFALNCISKETEIPLNKNKKIIEVYGHRGTRSYSPENTIPGYQSALKMGIHWADMDIVITKKDDIFVSHDLWLNPNITRDKSGNFITKENSLLFYNLTKKEIQKYDVGMTNPQSKYAKFFPDQVPVEKTKIPTLQEAIDFINEKSNKKVNFQMEIKTDAEHPEWSATPEKFASVLYQLLKKNHLIERTEIQAFDWRYLYAIQKLDKKIKTAYLVGSTEIAQMQDTNHLQKAGLWTGGQLLKDHNNSLPQMVKDLGGSCYEPEDITLTKEQLDESHQLGLKVVVWTWPEHFGKAFDPDVVSRLIDWGIDGIITDDPARLNAMLAARGYQVPQNYPES